MQTRTFSRADAVANTAKPMMVVFLLTIVIPVYFDIGGLRLSPYRLFLLFAFVPVVFAWLGGKCGRIILLDWLMLSFTLWAVLALFVLHGSATIQYSGIQAVETFTPYLLGRYFVRSISDYERFFKVMFVLLLFFIPAAVLESTQGMRIYNEVFKAFGTTFPWANYAPRMGMFRSQVVFEHPILYGVFCSTTFAPFYFMRRKGNGNRVQGVRRAWASLVATFFSLSTGAFLPVILQTCLIVWDHVLRNFAARWKLLMGLFAAGFVLIDLASNRTPFEVFISYLTFNSGTGYWRILIFDYGMQNVWENPIFGIGLGGWRRPAWMHSASVDNLWLLMALRYGIPAFLLIFAAYMTHIISIARSKLHDPGKRLVRKGYLFTMIGLGISLCTVHLWAGTFVYFMFLIGAGVWLIDRDDTAPETDQEAELAPERASMNRLSPAPVAAATFSRGTGEGPAYSRFAPRPTRKGEQGRVESFLVKHHRQKRGIHESK